MKNGGWLGGILSLAIIMNGCGGAETPMDPELLGGVSPYKNHRGGMYNGEKNFAYLINNFAKGQPARTPWAGFWWPYTSNGIASGVAGGSCSPAGKYDAARGATTHSQSWEVKNHGSQVPKIEGWWGHCNGWCAAAALYPEPRDTQRVNGIDFGIADQKALLSEAGMEASADFYGERVEPWDPSNSPHWDDTIPNQYFLVLTNYMGKQKMPVLIDRYTGSQVWNQPLVAYSIEYPKPEDVSPPTPEAPGIYKVLVTSTIWWAEDGVPPGIQTPEFTWEQTNVFTPRTLKAELWLDGPVNFGADGRITSSGNLVVARQGEALVGGEWRNGGVYTSEGQPDYMWVPYSIIRQDGTTQPGREQYANPDIDIAWLENHLLTGTDDSSVQPKKCEAAPSPRPRPSDNPNPTPRPSSLPNAEPAPVPSGA